MSARKDEIKVNVNENIAVNEPKFNEKNTTKFSTDNNNFNERTNNTLNQQQDAINKTLDNTLHNVKRTTDEATREIPKYTQRIAEYQEKTNLEPNVEKTATNTISKNPNIQLLKLGDKTISKQEWIFYFSFPKEKIS